MGLSLNTDLQTLKLLAQAGEELALILEYTTGYPDAPKRLLESEPKAVSVLTAIFCALIESGTSIPAPIAHLVSHVHAPALLQPSEA